LQVCKQSNLIPQDGGRLFFCPEPLARLTSVHLSMPEPKSGKESELVFITQKIADRLRGYIQDKGI
jgi:hypothetical protein